jgi:hypothetical protein
VLWSLVAFPVLVSHFRGRINLQASISRHTDCLTTVSHFSDSGEVVPEFWSAFIALTGGEDWVYTAEKDPSDSS